MSQLEIEFGKGTAKYFPCDVSNAEQFEGILKLPTTHSYSRQKYTFDSFRRIYIRSLLFFEIM